MLRGFLNGGFGGPSSKSASGSSYLEAICDFFKLRGIAVKETCALQRLEYHGRLQEEKVEIITWRLLFCDGLSMEDLILAAPNYLVQVCCCLENLPPSTTLS